MNIVLAWKNALYQETLSKEQRMLVPENSVGVLNLTDEDLANVLGGDGPDPSGIAGSSVDGLVDTGSGFGGNTFSLFSNLFGNLGGTFND